MTDNKTNKNANAGAFSFESGTEKLETIGNVMDACATYATAMYRDIESRQPIRSRWGRHRVRPLHALCRQRARNVRHGAGYHGPGAPITTAATAWRGLTA